jgi:hypothetical protein
MKTRLPQGKYSVAAMFYLRENAADTAFAHGKRAAF